MIVTAKLTDVELVNCAVCLKEIPKSDAEGVETWDTVVYLCGPQCYEEWEAIEMKERTQEAGEP